METAIGVNFKRIKNHLITGISYMIPVTVIGGIFYAGSAAFEGTTAAGEEMATKSEFLLYVQEIGGTGLLLMIPVLTGYITYAITGKPALTPGLVASYIANTEITTGGNAVKTGFLGALVLGFMTGYLAKYMKRIHCPELVKSVVPILIAPVVTSLIVCIFYMYILANPIGTVVGGIENFLTSSSSGSKTVLGIIMGMMVAVDMGGPANKAACLFSIGVMAEGHYEFFGIYAVPIYTTPLGMGLATLLAKNKYIQEEHDAGKASLFMDPIGVSEGAIPLAVTDPAKVIPSIMTDGAVGSAIAAVVGAKNYAPHGEPIVLLIIDKRIWFAIATIVGTLVTAILVNLLGKPVAQTGLVNE